MATALQFDLLKRDYNEAVVDAFYWEKQLPHSIEAILTTPNNPTDEAMHRRFLYRYHLKPEDVPLVVFNKDRVDCPFELYGAQLSMDPNARLDYRVNGMPQSWTQLGAAANMGHTRCGGLT